MPSIGVPTTLFDRVKPDWRVEANGNLFDRQCRHGSATYQ
jgi:hypothetical protein